MQLKLFGLHDKESHVITLRRSLLGSIEDDNVPPALISDSDDEDEADAEEEDVVDEDDDDDDDDDSSDDMGENAQLSVDEGKTID